MANAYILFDDRVLAATLSGLAPVSTLPLANLQDPQPSKVTRWTATSAHVVVDFGVSTPIGAVVAAGSNLTSSATRRVRLSSTDATGAAGDVHDSGTASAGASSSFRGAFAYTLSADLSARYLRLDVADATLTFIDLGLLLAGPAWRGARNFSYGAAIGYADFGVSETSPVGVTFTSQRARARSINMRFDFASELEAHTQLLELHRIAGITQNIAVIPDPAGSYRAQRLVVGTLEDLTPIINSQFNIWSTSLSVRERI